MTRGKLDRSIELMRREEHGRAGCGGAADQAIDQVAAALVEPGVRLIEEPELRPTDDHRSKRGPATLTGRQVAYGDVAKSVGDPESIERSVDGSRVDARCSRPEPQVLLDAQVLVEGGVVAEQADRSANRSTVGDDVVIEHEGAARLDPLEPGADAQQCRLTGPVRTLQQDDFTRTDREINSGEGREPAKQSDDAVKGDDGHPKRLPPHSCASACGRRPCLQ